MRLTEWWLAFAEDLDNLAPKISNTQSEPWLAARTMITEGVQLEANVLWGMQYAAKINVASQKLGPDFHNEIIGEKMHLPEVCSPDTLLFALVYCKHLWRYQLIDQGSSLILSKLINGRAAIQRAAEELKKRIDAYCSEPQHVGAVKQAFAEAVADPRKNLVEQLQQWVVAEPMVCKLVKQLESATHLAVEQYDLHHESIHSLFAKIGLFLLRKAAILRQIAANMQLISLLNQGTIMPEDLMEPQRLMHQYPDFFESWLKLDEDVSIAPNQAAVYSSRLLAGVVDLWNSLTQWTVAMLAPASLTEQRKQLLVSRAQSNIVNLSAELNVRNDAAIHAHDFKNLTAINVQQLADKMELVYSMLGLKKCLMLYQQEHITGWTKFSLLAFFKPITELLSQSFLRRLIFDKVLLVLEVQKLTTQVDALVQSAQAKSESEFDKDAVKKELVATLNVAQQKNQAVTQNSLFVFFKKESAVAAENLNAIITEAVQSQVFATL